MFQHQDQQVYQDEQNQDSSNVMCDNSFELAMYQKELYFYLEQIEHYFLEQKTIDDITKLQSIDDKIRLILQMMWRVQDDTYRIQYQKISQLEQGNVNTYKTHDSSHQRQYNYTNQPMNGEYANAYGYPIPMKQFSQTDISQNYYCYNVYQDVPQNKDGQRDYKQYQSCRDFCSIEEEKLYEQVNFNKFDQRDNQFINEQEERSSRENHFKMCKQNEQNFEQFENKDVSEKYYYATQINQYDQRKEQFFYNNQKIYSYNKIQKNNAGYKYIHPLQQQQQVQNSNTNGQTINRYHSQIQSQPLLNHQMQRDDNINHNQNDQIVDKQNQCLNISQQSSNLNQIIDNKNKLSQNTNFCSNKVNNNNSHSSIEQNENDLSKYPNHCNQTISNSTTFTNLNKQSQVTINISQSVTYQQNNTSSPSNILNQINNPDANKQNTNNIQNTITNSNLKNQESVQQINTQNPYLNNFKTKYEESPSNKKKLSQDNMEQNESSSLSPENDKPKKTKKIRKQKSQNEQQQKQSLTKKNDYSLNKCSNIYNISINSSNNNNIHENQINDSIKNDKQLNINVRKNSNSEVTNISKGRNHKLNIKFPECNEQASLENEYAQCDEEDHLLEDNEQDDQESDEDVQKEQNKNQDEYESASGECSQKGKKSKNGLQKSNSRAFDTRNVIKNIFNLLVKFLLNLKQSKLNIIEDEDYKEFRSYLINYKGNDVKSSRSLLQNYPEVNKIEEITNDQLRTDLQLRLKNFQQLPLKKQIEKINQYNCIIRKYSIQFLTNKIPQIIEKNPFFIQKDSIQRFTQILLTYIKNPQTYLRINC